MCVTVRARRRSGTTRGPVTGWPGLRTASPEHWVLPSFFLFLLAPGALVALPGEKAGAGCGLGKPTLAAVTAGPPRAGGKASRTRRGENWGADRSLNNAPLKFLFYSLTCPHIQGSLFKRRGQVQMRFFQPFK